MPKFSPTRAKENRLLINLGMKGKKQNAKNKKNKQIKSTRIVFVFKQATTRTT